MGASVVESVKLNHCWNESRSLKISGRMKLRRDQSSERLFCGWGESKCNGGWERTYMERSTGQDESVGARVLLELLDEFAVHL